ncbi:MAG: hypothetical protein EHM20_05590 [Alphaproteobacteria bacterium]|nr:MAG: hypothetical protein EHM20_05590 [Alphaproteobacteria bacterium]
MKNKIITAGLLFTLFSCSQVSETNPPHGEILSSTDTRTFHVKYYGKDTLKIGDRVRILEYEDTSTDLKLKKSRTLPFSTKNAKKKVLDLATISSVLDDDYYELKSDNSKHIPEDAIVEKL